MYQSSLLYKKILIKTIRYLHTVTTKYRQDGKPNSWNQSLQTLQTKNSLFVLRFYLNETILRRHKTFKIQMRKKGNVAACQQAEIFIKYCKYDIT